MTQLNPIDLEKKLDETLKINRDLQKKIDKIHHWHKIRQIFFWLKIAFIVVVIISAWIYLPPFISKLLKPYQDAWLNYQDTIDSFENFGSSVLQQ